jgi:acyl-CoA thioesterase-2
LDDELEKLLGYLEVERIDKYLFIGNSPRKPPRVFGGQVLSQALNAAIRTVDEERGPHSMHGYFLRPGNPNKQIVYEVDPIRDGRSFTTRRVVAKQDGIAIFNTSVSFHSDEPGLSHQFELPDVPPPEELESDQEFLERTAQESQIKSPVPRMKAIERRPVRRRDYENPQPTEPVQHIWFRALGDLGDDPCRHQTVLAFMSDYALLGAALLPHPYTGASKEMQSASLDHGLWFHRPFRADDYLLYSMDSPTAAGARGFSRGSFYTREGVLVASTVQESLLRVVDVSDN